jgi:hypothetical protein
MGEERLGRQAVAMIRLHAVVEGQTEETFVNNVLSPELGAQEIFVDVHRVTTGRLKRNVFRGGISKYGQLKTDLDLWMKQDQNPDAWFTTMIDFYALPPDFPGYDNCMRRGDAVKRVECIEEQMLSDLSSHRRFIPYIQLHEFEALLFSEPQKFEVAFPDRPRVTQKLTEIRNEFPTPEHINDGPDLAPSKRILSLLPGYRKPVAGLQVIQQIGLAKLRRECAHFNSWIAKIEKAVSG